MRVLKAVRDVEEKWVENATRNAFIPLSDLPAGPEKPCTPWEGKVVCP